MIQVTMFHVDDKLRIGSELKLAVDSGSEVHVIPKCLVELWSSELQRGENVLLKGAGQERLKYYGRLKITLLNWQARDHEHL